MSTPSNILVLLLIALLSGRIHAQANEVEEVAQRATEFERARVTLNIDAAKELAFSDAISFAPNGRGASRLLAGSSIDKSW